MGQSAIISAAAHACALLIKKITKFLISKKLKVLSFWLEPSHQVELLTGFESKQNKVSSFSKILLILGSVWLKS